MYKKNALSPVIATVIIMSVTIAVSVGAAYWLGGVTAQFFDYENIELTSINNAYSNDLWTITIELKNTGPSDVAILDILINNKEVNLYGSETPGQGSSSTDAPSNGFRLSSGKSGVLHIYIDGPGGTGHYGALSSGTSMNIVLRSSTGIDYSKMIVLT